MIRVIIFDVDGVIVHPAFSVFIEAREEIIRFLSKYGIRISVDSPFFKKVYDALRKKFNDTEKAWKIYLKASEIATEYELRALKNAAIEEKAREVISKLNKMGYIIAIYSLSGRKYVQEVVSKLELWSEIELIITREDAKPKPYPDGLLRICEKLNAKPQECIYVGDHYLDAEAARNAGCHAIILKNKKNRNNLPNLGNACIIDKLDALSIISCINRVSS